MRLGNFKSTWPGSSASPLLMITSQLVDEYYRLCVGVFDNNSGHRHIYYTLHSVAGRSCSSVCRSILLPRCCWLNPRQKHYAAPSISGTTSSHLLSVFVRPRIPLHRWSIVLGQYLQRNRCISPHSCWLRPCSSLGSGKDARLLESRQMLLYMSSPTCQLDTRRQSRWRVSLKTVLGEYAAPCSIAEPLRRRGRPGKNTIKWP